MSPLCILSNIRVKLTLHSSLENKIAKNYLYLSMLETQMVTSTPSENLALRLYDAQNQTFKFGTTKTLILHTRSIFFKGGHLTKIWSKKIFFMKTLSKLGALTVYLLYLYYELPLLGQQGLYTKEHESLRAPILKFPWGKKTKSKSIVYNMQLKYTGFCVILRVAQSRRAMLRATPSIVVVFH